MKQPTRSSPLHTLLQVREIAHETLCLAVPGKPQAREYHAVVEVGAINFSLMSTGEQEAVLEGFRSFLGRLTFDIDIHIKIEPYNLNPYLEQIETATRSDLLAETAADHKSFVLSLAAQRALLQRGFHIHVPADPPASGAKPPVQKKRKPGLAEAFDAARSQLDQRVTDIISDLERMGLSARRLKNLDLANYYLSGLHQQFAQQHPLTEASLEVADLPITASGTKTTRQENTVRAVQEPLLPAAKGSRTFPAPLALLKRAHKARHTQAQQSNPGDDPGLIRVTELVSPASIEVSRTYVRIHNLSDEYIRGFCIIGYPRQVVAGWLDRLISIDEPFIELCMRIHPLDATQYVNKLSRKIIAFKGTMRIDQRRGRTSDPYLQAALEDVDQLRDKLVRQEEQVFAVALYILARAKTKVQLEERTQRLYSQLASLDLRAVPLTMRHDKALLCTLPGRDLLKKRRILDTSSVITAYPFSDSVLSTSTGTLRGVTPRGGLIIMDDFSDTLENANECKFAKSGSGKSYDSKIRIIRSLLAGIQVSVIDPEKEYDRLVKRLGGQFVRLASGQLQMNPFELRWRAGEEESMLEDKYHSLLTLFDLLIADRKDGGILSSSEKGYLTKVLGWLYSSDREPCMQTFYQGLRDGVAGPDTFGIADRLERFVHLFPEKTQIALENTFTVFNIRDLDTDMKAVGLFLITEHIWMQMRWREKPTPHMLLIDEAWSLLQFEAGGRFLASIARRARKYYLGLVTVTQDVEDFLNSEHGRTILVNSSLKFLMKQDSTTIDAVSRAFKLSEGDKKFLLGAKKGEGLYFARGVHVPMQVVASPLEHRLATTNPREVAAILAEEEQAERDCTADKSAIGEDSRAQHVIHAGPKQDAA